MSLCHHTHCFCWCLFLWCKSETISIGLPPWTEGQWLSSYPLSAPDWAHSLMVLSFISSRQLWWTKKNTLLRTSGTSSISNGKPFNPMLYLLTLKKHELKSENTNYNNFISLMLVLFGVWECSSVVGHLHSILKGLGSIHITHKNCYS